MTKAKHTPGPWRVAPGKDYIGTELNIDAGIRGQGGFVAVAGQRGDPIAEADARLIAAAPDMLEALRGLLPIAVNDGPGGCDGKTPGCPQCDAIKIARDAIIKATGG